MRDRRGSAREGPIRYGLPQEGESLRKNPILIRIVRYKSIENCRGRNQMRFPGKVLALSGYSKAAGTGKVCGLMPI